MKINIEVDFDDLFDNDMSSPKDTINGIIKDDIKYQMKRCEGYKEYVKQAAADAVEKLGI